MAMMPSLQARTGFSSRGDNKTILQKHPRRCSRVGPRRLPRTGLSLDHPVLQDRLHGGIVGALADRNFRLAEIDLVSFDAPDLRDIDDGRFVYFQESIGWQLFQDP